MKKIDNKTKVCFLTASEMYHKFREKERLSALDKDLFLRKPIESEDLIKKVNTIISS
jgi:hypothetical protein